MCSPRNIFVGKSRYFQTTVESGASNRGAFDSDVLLLELSSVPECKSLDVKNSEKNKNCFVETIQTEFYYLFFSGYEIVRFTTEHKIIDFISNLGNNMVVYAKVVGEECRHVSSDHRKFVENGKIEKGTLLISMGIFLILLIIMF